MTLWRDRLQGWLASLSITPLGVMLLTLIVCGIGLAAFGPSGLQAPGFAVAAFVLFLLLAGGLSDRSTCRPLKTLADRRADFGARHREFSETGPGSEAEAELWKRERERYAQRDPAD